MAIKVLALHHHGVRVGETDADADRALGFYRDVLGLPVDQGRPYVADIPGYWIDVGGRAQIHLISAKGLSRLSDGKRIDPAGPHVALSVADIREAKAELERMGVEYWSISGVTGPSTEQVFVTDPHGNVIELHQAGVCRCDRAEPARAPAARA
jgi:catechol 2,3-dioxygenase-like lactoylglutathione lyase family enzyme